MSELITWLRAVLDEDEQVARAADDICESPWGRSESDLHTVRDLDGALVVDHGPATACAHIVRHDPASVLADIAAKRRILIDLSVVLLYPQAPSVFPAEYVSVLSHIVRVFASAYADRPGYLNEWAPDLSQTGDTRG